MMSNVVLYLHGFASSSASEKAQLTARYFAECLPQYRLVIPDLPYTPAEAVATIANCLADCKPAAVIGSSLGGFFATRVALAYGCPAALINPAVKPATLLDRHLGEYYHPVLQRTYQLTADHLPMLHALTPTRPSASDQILVLLQQGDEVLDYHDALDFYQYCHLDVQEGGDHSYQGYAKRLPDIVKFCQLA